MNTKIEAKNLNLFYGEKHALKDVNLNIEKNKNNSFYWIRQDVGSQLS